MTGTTAAPPRSYRFPVRGGGLTTLIWPGREASAPVVLAVHGITANAASWAAVATALDGAVTLVAPDLRGRAQSARLPGPYGISAHADDLIAVLDGMQIGQAPVVGHSMGAFVAALTGYRFPDRITRTLLVDGGLALPTPPGVDIDAMLTAVLGPSMERLSMRFADRDAYREFWQQHPAFTDREWTSVLEDYVMRDLVGQAPELRSSCVIDAIRADGGQILTEPAVVEAAKNLSTPTTLLWAERGLLDQSPGLYTEERLAALKLDPARVRTQYAADLNHFTILLDADGGAGLVAQHIRGLVS